MTDLAASTPLREIEFWFEFGSNYSYPAVMRVEEEAKRRNVRTHLEALFAGPDFSCARL